MMTLNEGYKHAQKAKPKLDYPYLGIPDIEEKDVEDYIKKE